MTTKGSAEEALLQSLTEIFPDAPVDFLEHECQDLVGKPEAIDRFIIQLATSSGQPPDDWKHSGAVAKASQKYHPVAGTSTGSKSHAVRELLLTLAEVFPDIPLSYLEEQCKTLVGKPTEIDRFVTNLASSESRPPLKKQRLDNNELHAANIASHLLPVAKDDRADNRLVNLISMFPFVDPDFLQKKGSEFGYDKCSEEALMQWINANIDEGYKEFPTRADYENRIEQAEKVAQKAKLSVNEILDVYEDPNEYFQDQKRDLKRDNEVRAFIKDMEEQRQDRIEWSRKAGILMECKCCFSDDCLEEDMLPCQGGHFFCKECIQRSSKVAIGEAQTHLKCLGQCDKNFKLTDLQRALKANVFSKWLKKIQVDELERAGVEGLEQCPFCPFATIMTSNPEENKIFNCQNPDCGKESCRLCHQISHIPQRCREIEKDAEVQKRIDLETKLTAALIKKCYKCRKPFVKLDGCNKITCSCGATMCYICGKPVTSYNHYSNKTRMSQEDWNRMNADEDDYQFDGRNADNDKPNEAYFDHRPTANYVPPPVEPNQEPGDDGDYFEGPPPGEKCPLYSNTKKMHENAVARVEEEAKKKNQQRKR